jgi:hypothetical protein
VSYEGGALSRRGAPHGREKGTWGPSNDECGGLGRAHLSYEGPTQSLSEMIKV